MERLAGLRTTLHDIAREAGVSSATVDRVLNNRPGVRERTRDIVMETARRLGYFGATGLGDGGIGTTELAFILPAGDNPFIANLAGHLSGLAAARPQLAVSVRRIEGFSPERLADALNALPAETEGVGIVALDHPVVREAMRAADARGIRLVTLASDVHHVPRIAYVGVDNRAAGRLAGYMLGRFLGPRPSAEVALFAGSLSYRGHEEREMGFRHVLAEDFPSLEIVELRETRDAEDRAFDEAAALLEARPGLAAIYNIGGGNVGIARALKAAGRVGDVVFIAHDLTEATRTHLLDGTVDAVIDQNPRVEAREALNILATAIRGEPYEPHLPRLQVILRENIPEA